MVRFGIPAGGAYVVGAVESEGLTSVLVVTIARGGRSYADRPGGAACTR